MRWPHRSAADGRAPDHALRRPGRRATTLRFAAERGDITALIGPNGAGKTTVFNCITGFYKPTEGMMTLTHPDGSGLSARAHARFPDRLARQGRPHLPEHPPVLRHDGAGEPDGRAAQPADARLGLHCSAASSASATTRRPRRAAVEKARDWLDSIGLIDRADDPAGDLPYGAQRRLEIARAMCTDPVLLCLDEPAAGLNPRESAELNELLLSIRKEHGTSILLIEHDMSVVMEISDHVVVLEYGIKISDGTPAEVRNDPRGHRRLSRRRGRGSRRSKRRSRMSADGPAYDAPLAARGPRRQTYYGNIIALQRRRHRGQRGRDRHADRRQRRRQIDPDDDDLRQSARPRRHASSSRAATSRRCRRTRSRACRIAQSPEGRRIFPRMTVYENLQMGASLAGMRAFRRGLERVFASSRA